MHNIIIYVAQWWEKYLSKHSPLKHTYSWHDKLIVLWILSRQAKISLLPSANVFVFGDFNVHPKDWLAILVELINLVNSVIILLSQMTLLRWLTFLHGSQTVILIALLFWTYFFFLMLVFVLQWLSLHWEILIRFLSQFLSTFKQIQNRMPLFKA